MSLLRRGQSEDSPGRVAKPERPPPPRMSSKDTEFPPTASCPARPSQATPTVPPQAAPSAPPLVPHDQSAFQNQQQGPYASMPPGAYYQAQAPPSGVAYQAPPPGTYYHAPPPGAPYYAPPPGASYAPPPYQPYPTQPYQGGPPQLYQGGPPQPYQGGPPQQYQGGPPQQYQGGPPQQYQGGPPQQYQGGPPQQYQGGPPQQYQGGPPQLYQGSPAVYQSILYPNGAAANMDSISPLQMHEVRWFHTKNGKYWQPFCGGDSLALEIRYQVLQKDRSVSSSVDVMGDLYEANVETKMCRSIYWSDPQELFRNIFADPKKVNAYEMSAQLLTAQLITKEEKDKVESSKGSLEDKSAMLLLAIEGAIKLDDTVAKFDAFLGVLEQFSKYQDIVKKVKGDHFAILRGTWFEVQGEKWYPFEEKEAVEIEKKHCGTELREKMRNEAMLRQVADDRLKSLGKPSQQASSVLDRLALDKCEIIWMSNGDTWKQKKDIQTSIVTKIGEVIKKPESFGGISVKRGYKEAAIQEDAPSPIGHLVFIIHGIGQNMDSADIAQSTSDFRETCTQVAKKNFPDQWKEKRVEFIPLDWRTSLTLDDGMLTNITLHGVKSLRDLLNDSVLDIFFYTSPKYGPEILNGLHIAIHKQYRQFITRHPYFHQDGGALSIFAHSLGSVMTYDLLHETCLANNIIHDNPTSVPLSLPIKMEYGGGVKYNPCAQPVTEKSGEEKTPKPDPVIEDVNYDKLKQAHLKLDFTVEHFFAVGSPLGVFILMREHESLVKRGHRSSASLIPTEVCRRIHNLHHPSDPVAYRLEPLINEAYANIKPVKIDNASSKPSKTALDHAEGPKTDETLSASNGQSGSWMTSIISVVTNSKKQAPEPKTDKDKLFENDNHLSPGERLKERIDFGLKEGLVDISYINTITAHTSYWTSADCAFYVLLQIYKYRCKSVV